ncbi:serine/threonine-protein phosphatase [Couchioplanes caeruleus]|uniref:PP2C family protein-serine/threonine phosphatase n=1 Tax=Couchioplanes caeruleus TaxID=56438 RepID=UPI0020C07426|nr:PP2C family protein-serine/threonine phosphatase [Couchioplanes caeruleus]UQU62901.1 serine/threonine-protein phosphatase [Couchioplanes caeruleus]
MADPMEAVRRLLDLRHRSRPEDLPPILDAVAPLLGAARITALMVDYEQISLWPLHGTASDSAPRKVDDTLAGQAFSTARTAYAEPCLWVPLLHGAERLGVLEVWLDAAPDEPLRRDLEAIAALVAELIASRRFYGDAVELTRRRQPMQLAAEIIWNQLPPLTFAANGTLVTAVLEPCYDVGGDAFDYAANGDLVHVALFDTVGHGIGASALTTLTLNTYRNARRCGLGLADTYRSIDKWIRAQYPGAFVTAVLAELDTATGTYRRIAAGHPAELHLRGDQEMPALPTPTALPLGLGHMLPRPPGVTEMTLQRGDALVFYTDGITEARSADGELFGLDRLSAFVRQEMHREIPAPELMRHLIHTIVSYENGELRDDATAALVQWRSAG